LGQTKAIPKRKTLPLITRIGQERLLVLGYWLLVKFKFKAKPNHNQKQNLSLITRLDADSGEGFGIVFFIIFA
jgi:hypothetical protein